MNTNPVITIVEDDTVKAVFSTNSNEHAEQLFAEIVRGIEKGGPALTDDDYIQMSLDEGYWICANQPIVVSLVHPTAVNSVYEALELI